jgi:hypothetical protein
MYSSNLSLTSALDGTGWSTPSLGRLHPPPPRKEDLYPLYRRLSGPRGRSSRVRKISPPPVVDPRAAQCVASCCAECVIPDHFIRKAPDKIVPKPGNFVTYSPGRQVRYNNTGIVKIMLTLMDYLSPADRRTPWVTD